MKNITLLSLVAAALLFTACGEKTKEAATEATNKVTEAVKEDTASVVEATKKAATEAAEAAKTAAADAAEATAAKAAEVKKAAEDKASEAAQALKERAAAATAAASATAASAAESVQSAATSVVESAKEVVADNTAGKAAYAKCAGCHGADGKTKALGKSAVIAGEAAADLETKIAAYKAGTRNIAGMGMLMKGQVASLSDEDIKAVAAYISSL